MKHKPSDVIYVLAVTFFAAVGIFLFIISRGASSGAVEVEISDLGDNYPVEILNSATIDDFKEVEGIGQVRAEQIIALRNALGGFKSASQLKSVSGISDAIYNRIIDHFYSVPAEENTPPPAVTVTEADIDTKNSDNSENSEDYSYPEPSETSAPEATSKPETSKPETSKPETKSPEPEKTAPKDTTEKEISEPENPASDDHDDPKEHAAPSLVTVNINTATADEIIKCLGLSEDQALEIIDLRDKIGRFSTVEELYLLDFMNKDLYQKIKNYLIFD